MWVTVVCDCPCHSDPQPGDFDEQIRRGMVEVERHEGDPSAKFRIVRP